MKNDPYLNSLDRYQFKYAFLGTGYHSISNLYPCLENLNVPLKYIYSRQVGNAKKLSQRFPGCTPQRILSKAYLLILK